MRKVEAAVKVEKIRITTCGLDVGAGNVNCSDRHYVQAVALTPVKDNKGIEDETVGQIGLCGNIHGHCRYRGDMSITALFVFNPFSKAE